MRYFINNKGLNGPCHRTVPKIRIMYSQKLNWAASFPIPTFMYLWKFYIPGSVCLFGSSKIGRPITDTWMWEKGDMQNILILLGNNKVTQLNFWQYINRNQAFILDIQPFICSADRPGFLQWLPVLLAPKRLSCLLPCCAQESFRLINCWFRCELGRPSLGCHWN